MNCQLTGCRRPRATKGYISPLNAVNTLRRSQWQRLCYPFLTGAFVSIFSVHLYCNYFTVQVILKS